MSEAFSVGDIVTYIGKLAGKPLQCKVDCPGKSGELLAHAKAISLSNASGDL
jgi:hypothetical protein